MHQQKHWILAYFKTTIWEWEIDRSYEGKRKQKLRLEYNSVVGVESLPPMWENLGVSPRMLLCVPGHLSHPGSKAGHSVRAAKKTRRLPIVCWLCPPSSWPCCPFLCLAPLPLLFFSCVPLGTHSSQGIAWALPEGSHKCLTSEICCISQNFSRGMAVTVRGTSGGCVRMLQGRSHPQPELLWNTVQPVY